uniref:cupin domain-containing protein n=1 Tax=Burkholderia arboris TaxID=488730 RepID=UPI003BEF1D14
MKIGIIPRIHRNIVNQVLLMKYFVGRLIAAFVITVSATGVSYSMETNVRPEAAKDRTYWIRQLGLTPHPEGGYYRYVFGAEQSRMTAGGAVRRDFSGIFFLVTRDSPSHLHQLKSDEIWYFHAGHPLTMHVIDEEGAYHRILLGPDIDKGEILSVVMRAGWIFGSSVDEGDYGLVSCTVVPGYDDADYKLFTQAELLSRFPSQQEIIMKLAYKNVPE